MRRLRVGRLQLRMGGLGLAPRVLARKVLWWQVLLRLLLRGRDVMLLLLLLLSVMHLWRRGVHVHRGRGGVCRRSILLLLLRRRSLRLERTIPFEATRGLRGLCWWRRLKRVTVVLLVLLLVLLLLVLLLQLLELLLPLVPRFLGGHRRRTGRRIRIMMRLRLRLCLRLRGLLDLSRMYILLLLLRV